jgi:hypothetical protein
MGDAGADPPNIEGRPKLVRRHERISLISPPGGSAGQGPAATLEAPGVMQATSTGNSRETTWAVEVAEGPALAGWELKGWPRG